MLHGTTKHRTLGIALVTRKVDLRINAAKGRSVVNSWLG
jgi:hypothetical protein